ncbi:LuxR C-terminal-related transcriptional regulator [Kitasatospora sp. NPDC091257]|uniref:response regulator transcription factor n=1 Tax=unclassified Kitasatospora TaxID=2633591 RepID=UPI002F906B1F
MTRRQLTDEQWTFIEPYLPIGESTVKTHVNHLFAKIGTRTRTEAVAWAHQNGYGEPS